MSIVSTLRDTCFVLASDALRQIADAFEEEVGRKPSAKELGEILTEGARGAAADLVNDGTNGGISFSASLEKTNGKFRSPSRGDIVLVPYGKPRRYAVMLCLGKCGSFGTAFGLFGEALGQQTIPAGWKPEGAYAYPLFVGIERIQNGEWPVVARRNDLLHVFREPELFHHPENDPGDGSYGSYGLGESVSGSIRQLQASEAAVIFNQGEGRYQQAFTGVQFEEYLAKVSQRPRG